MKKWVPLLKKYKPVYCTVKSLSEALIFASTNPQYDDRLFNELQVQLSYTNSHDSFIKADWIGCETQLEQNSAQRKQF